CPCAGLRTPGFDRAAPPFWLGKTMRKIGMLLWAGGIGLAIYAVFVFTPSVNGMHVNFDLQQRQMMMLIVACVLFAVGVGLHAFAAHVENAPIKSAGSKPKKAQNPVSAKIRATDNQLAEAKRLGIVETREGYGYAGNNFTSIDDAISVARL
ncbi:hypothetical protein, partial [Escherichia coli]|uniref:hypothetical protein n=1 Tax=Escherichia coli TaxID=562 RepID=UPI001BFC8A00